MHLLSTTTCFDLAAGAAARLRGRRGVTLLELLVVLLILLMVTAASVPIIAPALRNRQVREASRLLSAYLGAAKARAVQTGRPVGIKIERFNGQPYALTVSQVEVPPPYMGDVFGATCCRGEYHGPRCSAHPRLPAGPTIPRDDPAMDFDNDDGGTCNYRLIRVGDRIQFGGPGSDICHSRPENRVADPMESSTRGTNIDP